MAETLTIHVDWRGNVVAINQAARTEEAMFKVCPKGPSKRERNLWVIDGLHLYYFVLFRAGTETSLTPNW